MRNFKRFLCFFIAVIMLTSISVSTFAGEMSNQDYSKIISGLQMAENSKEQMGLANVNFNDFEIGSAIKSYSFTEAGFVETYEYYPLVINHILTA